LPQINKPPSALPIFQTTDTTQLVLPVHAQCAIPPQNQEGKEANQTSSPAKPTCGTDPPDLLLLLHSLIAGAARRVHRDGTKIAGMVVPIPRCSGLLHLGSPEHLLDLAIVLLQHLVDGDA
jgi:hypothetical protein